MFETLVIVDRGLGKENSTQLKLYSNEIVIQSQKPNKFMHSSGGPQSKKKPLSKSNRKPFHWFS